jgi:CheY-like chemotaxis protein
MEIDVADSGIGISTEGQAKLFQPFSQVDSSNSRRHGGTGLGLAICQRLCALMGGGIEVTSTPGQGSCFRFNVRASRVPSELPGTEARAPIPASAPVFFYDGLPTNRAMLQHCLAAWQLSGQGFDEAALARSAAPDGSCSVAIIGLGSSGAPGGEYLANLRSARPQLPIIVLDATAGPRSHSDPDDPLVFHLAKPVKPAALYDALRHALVGSQMAETGPRTVEGLAIRLAESIPLEILLVEDNVVNQKVALRFLQRLGYQADAVANGLEAVQAVQARDYRLVFMDIQMPEMDGFSATREIRRKIADGRQPVIIALTANAMQGDREKCLDAGMNDFISKPVRMDEIEHVIRRYFGLKAGRTPAEG